MQAAAIASHIQELRALISAAEYNAGRHLGGVKLLAVSKGRFPAEIRYAYAAGLHDFAESYVQESRIKLQELSDLAITWHFIGKIQSNKASFIAKNFSWVHSVVSAKIAIQLNAARIPALGQLNICLQLNLDAEKTKIGVNLDSLDALIKLIYGLPYLNLRGLMIIPKTCINPQQQYLAFLRLTQLLFELNQKLQLNMDTLSMGMSQDYPAAICAGSTIIRIGTAIFGAVEGVT